MKSNKIYIDYDSSDPNDFSLIELIKSDYLRYYATNRGGIKLYINLLTQMLTCLNHCLVYSVYLRLSSRNNLLYYFAKYKKFRLGRKYGIQIPSSTKIGPGFYIGHGIGIVINVKTIIGQNCNVSQFLSIGSNKNTPAIIGDRVYIGPHVSIVENVNIGNDVKIGAGTVVINDIPSNSTSVGNPNRIIKK